jgi:hypothetical protein
MPWHVLILLASSLVTGKTYRLLSGHRCPVSISRVQKLSTRRSSRGRNPKR